MLLIQLHSLTNLSPPLISQSCRFRSAVKPGSFPPGEAKNSEDFGDDHSTNCSIAGAAGRQVGDPYKSCVKTGGIPFYQPSPKSSYNRTVKKDWSYL